MYYALSQRLGVNAVARRAVRHRVLVLAYHGVLPDEILSDDYRDRNVIGLRRLREQLEYVGSHYHPVTTKEIIDWATGSGTLPPASMLLTFDDGLRNNAIHAATLLQQLGMPALFNLPTEHIGGSKLLWTHELLERVYQWQFATLPTPDGSELGPGKSCAERSATARTLGTWCKQLSNNHRIAYMEQLRQLQGAIDTCAERYDFMSWAEAAALQKHGFEFGSHSATHPILTRVHGDALAFELKESKRKIEQQLGTVCTAITYPNGGPQDISEEVLDSAVEAGYRLGFVMDGRLAAASSNSLCLSRISTPGDISATAFKGIVSGLDQIRRSITG